jgi:hypothetical protein
MRNAAALALGSSPIVTFGALQLLGPHQPGQWSMHADEFSSLRFWLTLSVMLLAGAFGGIAYELLLRKGAIELPHRATRRCVTRRRSPAPAETMIVLGTLGRALVGAAAAMTVLLVVTPSTAQAAIALGVTAGAGAPATIRLMKKQLTFAADAISRLGHNTQPSEARTKVSQPAHPLPAPAPQTA